MEEIAKKRGPGRPARIGTSEIMAAAVAVIDEAGLDSCTMRTVADRLGVTPMSIYRHVSDKSELLERIPDSLLTSVAEDVIRKRRARSALVAVADGLGEVLDTHPHLAPLFHQPKPGPAMQRAGAHCVDLLVSEGCPEEDAFEVLRALVSLVVGQAVTTHGTRNPLGIKLFPEGVAGILHESWEQLLDECLHGGLARTARPFVRRL